VRDGLTPNANNGANGNATNGNATNGNGAPPPTAGVVAYDLGTTPVPAPAAPPNVVVPRRR
jgi:hypothetical protein